MKWHIHEVPFLLTHLPHAVHDLMHHEDAGLVQKTIVNVKPSADSDAPRHRIITEAPPAISIEKTLDPIAQRSVQNIGLLLHDYVSQLPSFDISGAEADKLAKHWQKILLEQPGRLSTVHTSHWHDEKTKAFWQEKLAAHSKALGVSPEALMEVWDDWQRASGAQHSTGQSSQKQAMQEKQWQDLVMRARLHHETMKRESGQSPTRTLHY